MDTIVTPTAPLKDQTGKKTRIAKPTVPQSDLSLATVAQQVAAYWIKSPMRLTWTTPEDFALLVNTFSARLGQRTGEGTTRPQLTQRLRELDAQMDHAIGYVKDYLAEEVGRDNTTGYLAQLGIEKVSATYKLPLERSRRVVALETLLRGIEARGYAKRTYGVAYWKPLLAEYREKVALASQKDSAIAGQVSAKNQSKVQVRKTLNALVLLIKANHPDTAASELRQWGFQKEKY
jgi:hypothetical protein